MNWCTWEGKVILSSVIMKKMIIQSTVTAIPYLSYTSLITMEENLFTDAMLLKLTML